MASEVKYLTADQLIEVNRRVLREIKVKKADTHRILSRMKIEVIVKHAREMDGGLYEKAAFLLIEIVKGHAFESGNRRTAYATAKLFLEANGLGMNAPFKAKILTGIREDFYRTEEVIQWLKGNGIRKFYRA